MRTVDLPRRALTTRFVPAHWSSSPALRSRRARNHRARLTLRHRAASFAGEFVRGPAPLALRTSSWWTKNSLRVGKLRTQPIRKKPRGGPERNVATSQENSRQASALLRRSANRAHPPGTTSPGAARESCSRSTRCETRSRVVHGSRRVGASAPSSSNRSASCARSTTSNRGPAIAPKHSERADVVGLVLRNGHPLEDPSGRRRRRRWAVSRPAGSGVGVLSAGRTAGRSPRIAVTETPAALTHLLTYSVWKADRFR